jgi:hypothetical protein
VFEALGARRCRARLADLTSNKTDSNATAGWFWTVKNPAESHWRAVNNDGVRRSRPSVAEPLSVLVWLSVFALLPRKTDSPSFSAHQREIGADYAGANSIK